MKDKITDKVFEIKKEENLSLVETTILLSDYLECAFEEDINEDVQPSAASS